MRKLTDSDYEQYLAHVKKFERDATPIARELLYWSEDGKSIVTLGTPDQTEAQHEH
jgi:hypothetical protein